MRGKRNSRFNNNKMHFDFMQNISMLRTETSKTVTYNRHEYYFFIQFSDFGAMPHDCLIQTRQLHYIVYIFTRTFVRMRKPIFMQNVFINSPSTHSVITSGSRIHISCSEGGTLIIGQTKTYKP